MRPPDEGEPSRVAEWNGSVDNGRRRGRLAVAMLCKWDTIERGRSEHKGSDSPLVIDQIASEDGCLTVDTFLDFVLLSVEVE